MRSRAIGLLYLLAAVGCERACASATDNAGTAVAVKQDCPTGLARCVNGAVEITEGRATCPGCPCGWKRVQVCQKGCIAEGLELVRDPADAPTLCAESKLAAMPPPGEVPLVNCPAGDRFWCHDHTVFACPQGASAVPVNICTYGCREEGDGLGDPSIDIGGASRLLCLDHRRVTGDP
jgi:hypothetical protein